ARTYNNLGALQRGQPAIAAKWYERACRIQERLVNQHREIPQYQLELARTYHNLGFLRCETGEFAPAASWYERAQLIQEDLVTKNPDVTTNQHELARTYHSLGNLQRHLGRPGPAQGFYEHAREIQETVVAAQPDVIIYRKELSDTCCNIGGLQKDAGNSIGALKSCEQGLAVIEPFIQKHPGDQSLRGSLIDLRLGRGSALACLGKHAEAAAEASLVYAEKSLTGINLYNLACTWAQAAAAADQDAMLPRPERDQLQEQYAGRAVAAL